MGYIYLNKKCMNYFPLTRFMFSADFENIAEVKKFPPLNFLPPFPLWSMVLLLPPWSRIWLICMLSQCCWYYYGVLIIIEHCLASTVTLGVVFIALIGWWNNIWKKKNNMTFVCLSACPSVEPNYSYNCKQVSFLPSLL